MQGVLVLSMWPSQGSCPQWTSGWGLHFQSKTEASRIHKAIFWHLSVTTSEPSVRGKHTLVSESIPEEEALGGGLRERVPDFLAQHA